MQVWSTSAVASLFRPTGYIPFFYTVYGWLPVFVLAACLWFRETWRKGLGSYYLHNKGTGSHQALVKPPPEGPKAWRRLWFYVMLMAWLTTEWTGLDLILCHPETHRWTVVWWWCGLVTYKSHDEHFGYWWLELPEKWVGLSHCLLVKR